MSLADLLGFAGLPLVGLAWAAFVMFTEVALNSPKDMERREGSIPPSGLPLTYLTFPALPVVLGVLTWIVTLRFSAALGPLVNWMAWSYGFGGFGIAMGVGFLVYFRRRECYRERRAFEMKASRLALLEVHTAVLVAAVLVHLAFLARFDETLAVSREVSSLTVAGMVLALQGYPPLGTGALLGLSRIEGDDWLRRCWLWILIPVALSLAAFAGQIWLVLLFG